MTLKQSGFETASVPLNTPLVNLVAVDHYEQNYGANH